MTFLKKLFHFDGDAGIVEKIVTVCVPVIAAILFAWLFGSCWQLLHNDISIAAHSARASAKIIGWILFLVALFWAWWNWSDRIPFHVNETAATIFLLLLLICSVLSYMDRFIF